MEGPGFNRGMEVNQLVSHVDFAPTLLAAAGLNVPASMQGHNILPLLDRRIEGWRDEVYFEMSEFITGRGLRTPQYTYAAADPKVPGWQARPTVNKYVEYMLYDLYSDPYQQVNLAGRAPYQKTAAELRQRLRARMREASGEQSTIDPAWFPYS
jgi:arylsulfatase A-like enzyme